MHSEPLSHALQYPEQAYSRVCTGAIAGTRYTCLAIASAIFCSSFCSHAQKLETTRTDMAASDQHAHCSSSTHKPHKGRDNDADEPFAGASAVRPGVSASHASTACCCCKTGSFPDHIETIRQTLRTHAADCRTIILMRKKQKSELKTAKFELYILLSR